jgi:hypothetical protein
MPPTTTTTTAIPVLPHETNGEWIRLCRHGQWEDLRTKIEASPSMDDLPPQLFRWVIRSRNVPIDFLRYLLDDVDDVDTTNWLGSANRLTGSVLHEAIQYQPASTCHRRHYGDNTIDIPMFLLSRMTVRQQQQEQQQQSSSDNLLLLQDGRGRTVLHCILQSWVRTSVHHPAPPSLPPPPRSFAHHALQSGHLDLDGDNDGGYGDDYSNCSRSSNSKIALWNAAYSACPASVAIMDSDGTTPLMLLLMMADTILPKRQLDQMLAMILSDQPWVVAVAPRRLIPIHRLQSTMTMAGQTNNSMRTAAFAPTALYYALLAGRSASTLQLLLRRRRRDDNDNDGNDSDNDSNDNDGNDNEDCGHSSKDEPGDGEQEDERCRIVTAYGETPLMIAVASHLDDLDISRLLSTPTALKQLDSSGLSVLDWLWLASVRSLCLQQQNQQNQREQQQHQQQHHQQQRHQQQQRHHVQTAATTTTLLHPARRRYLPADFTQHNHRYEAWLRRQCGMEKSTAESDDDGDDDDNNDYALTDAQCDDILRRLTALLLSKSYPNEHSAFPSTPTMSREMIRQLIHAVCRYQCPRGLLLVLLRSANIKCGSLLSSLPNSGSRSNSSSSIASHRDPYSGRLPLHDVVTKQSYLCCYRVGIFGRTGIVDEEDATMFLHDILAACPRAARVTDHRGQLPLHIAIASAAGPAQRYRRRLEGQRNDHVGTNGGGAQNHQFDANYDDAAMTTDEDDDEPVSSFDNGHNHSYYETIRLLLDAYPGAIWRRDGPTRLYPAFQAAATTTVSDAAAASATQEQLSVIYYLLRQAPTVLHVHKR